MFLSFRKARSFWRRPHGLRDRKQQRPLREEQSDETPEIADRTDTDNPFQDNHCLATAPDGAAPTTAVLAPMVTIRSAMSSATQMARLREGGSWRCRRLTRRPWHSADARASHGFVTSP